MMCAKFFFIKSSRLALLKQILVLTLVTKARDARAPKDARATKDLVSRLQNTLRYGICSNDNNNIVNSFYNNSPCNESLPIPRESLDRSTFHRKHMFITLNMTSKPLSIAKSEGREEKNKFSALYRIRMCAQL